MARCGLLDDVFRPFLAAVEGLRLALAVDGVCHDVLSGMGDRGCYHGMEVGICTENVC